MPRSPTRNNTGFELAKASQRWNELLYEEFCSRGFPDVRPSYGSVLLPLFEEDGLRMGELAARARLSKQTMTTLIRLMQTAGLVDRRRDPADARASIVTLADRAREFAPVAVAAVAALEARLTARMTAEEQRCLRSGLRTVMDL